MLLVAVKVRDTPPVSESGSSPEEAVCGGTFCSLNLHSPVRKIQTINEGSEEGKGGGGREKERERWCADRKKEWCSIHDFQRGLEVTE